MLELYEHKQSGMSHRDPKWSKNRLLLAILEAAIKGGLTLDKNGKSWFLFKKKEFSPWKVDFDVIILDLNCSKSCQIWSKIAKKHPFLDHFGDHYQCGIDLGQGFLLLFKHQTDPFCFVSPLLGNYRVLAGIVLPLVSAGHKNWFFVNKAVACIFNKNVRFWRKI